MMKYALALLAAVVLAASPAFAQTAIFKDTQSGSTGNWNNVGLRSRHQTGGT